MRRAARALLALCIVASGALLPAPAANAVPAQTHAQSANLGAPNVSGALQTFGFGIPDGKYKVTFVARQCPNYPDIMANRWRYSRQESLARLGKDSVYAAGQPVDPSIEGPNDPQCTPLYNWRFTL